jgi:rubrerythrin
MSTIGGGSAEPEPAEGFVEFLSSGARAKGEYQCAECGYGVTIFSVLPRCPMCGGGAWEQTTWSPFARAVERA